MCRGVVVCLVIASIVGCNANDQHAVHSVVQGNDIFTVKAYQEIAKDAGDENIIVSGLSAEIVLSLLANGAKGQTRTQLLKGLGLPNNLKTTNHAYQQILSHLRVNTNNLKLLSANKIYPAQGFSIANAFNDTAVNVFDGGIQTVDYTNSQLAADTINQWVEQQTNNKIKDLLSANQLKASTAMVVVNALYFSGKWNNNFNKYATQKKPFYVSATKTKEVDMMHTQTWANYAYDKKLRAKFLKLGFQGGKVSITFVLPDSKTGLKSAETNLKKYLAPRKFESARVAVSIPKFKIESKTDFKPILTAFGITDLFTSAADLSGITDSAQHLKVDFILQKAFIDCNEDGVEAAAATAIGLAPKYALEEPAIKYNFEADHSFFFYIRDDNSGATLFIGRYNQ